MCTLRQADMSLLAEHVPRMRYKISPVGSMQAKIQDWQPEEKDDTRGIETT